VSPNSSSIPDVATVPAPLPDWLPRIALLDDDGDAARTACPAEGGGNLILIQVMCKRPVFWNVFQRTAVKRS
jgi:hypothetical protein